MRDGAGVAVVPVGDPGERLAGGHIDGVGPAAELLRAQVDPIAECLARFVELARIDDPAGQLGQRRQGAEPLQALVHRRPSHPCGRELQHSPAVDET